MADGNEKRNTTSKAILSFLKSFPSVASLNHRGSIHSEVSHQPPKVEGSRKRCRTLYLLQPMYSSPSSLDTTTSCAETPSHSTCQAPPSPSPPKEHRWKAGNPSVQSAMPYYGHPTGVYKTLPESHNQNGSFGDVVNKCSGKEHFSRCLPEPLWRGKALSQKIPNLPNLLLYLQTKLLLTTGFR